MAPSRLAQGARSKTLTPLLPEGGLPRFYAALVLAEVAPDRKAGEAPNTWG